MLGWAWLDCAVPCCAVLHYAVHLFVSFFAQCRTFFPFFFLFSWPPHHDRFFFGARVEDDEVANLEPEAIYLSYLPRWRAQTHIYPCAIRTSFNLLIYVFVFFCAGPIPLEMAEIPHLTDLDLTENRLEGTRVHI